MEKKFPTTLILRHRRENLKKCSLQGLEKRADMRFYSYPNDLLPPLNGYFLLDIEAPLLTEADAGLGIFLLDATWRYTEKMCRVTEGAEGLVKRRLPDLFRTAYPRRQEDCLDPERGLASVEALFVAYWIMGRDCNGLLDGYYWKDQFLEKNKQFLDI
jgi:pre-rRNA-processing protein TSR3